MSEPMIPDLPDAHDLACDLTEHLAGLRALVQLLEAAAETHDQTVPAYRLAPVLRVLQTPASEAAVRIRAYLQQA